MSIANEISRLLLAKADIKEAIENKGISVPDNETIDLYSSYIDEISNNDSEEKDVVYIDYDGTVVALYTALEFALLESHPANPDHTDKGLTAQGWNWDLADAKQQVEEAGFLTIGLDYITTDGYTRYVIDTTDWNDLTCNTRVTLSKKNGTKVNWGDGTEEDTFVGNANVRATVSHTYATPGIYTITIKPDSDCDLKTIGGNSYPSPFSYWYSNTAQQKILTGLLEVYIGRTTATVIPRIGGHKLKWFTIPKGFTSANSYCFDEAFSLKSITLPKGCTTIEGNNRYNFKLEYVSLPKELTSIGPSAFSNALSLKHVSIPPNVTALEVSIFQNCYSLKKVYIPDGVTSVGNYCFDTCVNLEEICFPDSVTTLGTSILTLCYSLKKIQFSKNLDIIPQSTCNQCWNLKELTLPTILTTINKSAFNGCFSLKSLIIPNAVTALTECFRYPHSLESLTLPANITSIPDNAFQECFSLKSLTIPNGVVSIGSSAFSDCYSLEEIRIPDSVTTIGNSTFGNATSVKRVYIGSGITKMGTYFINSNNAAQIEGIWIYATTPPTIGSLTWSSSGTCPIYVPAGSLEAYLTALYWSATSVKNRLLEMSS